jgi:hypothetical protein
LGAGRFTSVFRGEVEGQILGGFAAGAGGFLEGDVAYVEGALEVLRALDEAWMVRTL